MLWRSVAPNTAYAPSRRPTGESGASPQFCPPRLNQSGGAPALTPLRVTPGLAQAMALAGLTPTAMSWYRPIGMPAARARPCTAASC